MANFFSKSCRSLFAGYFFQNILAEWISEKIVENNVIYGLKMGCLQDLYKFRPAERVESTRAHFQKATPVRKSVPTIWSLNYLEGTPSFLENKLNCLFWDISLLIGKFNLFVEMTNSIYSLGRLH